MQTFSPKQYLKIDIANSFGLDKKDWDERLAWFEANEHNLLPQLAEAENPAMYYAGIKAWEDVQAGRPSGYPISLDATSSGIQILSVLTGDEKAALISNVIDSGHRQDAYQLLFEAMQRKLGDYTTSFSREELKRSFMTAFYGSKAVPEEVFGPGRMLAAFYQTLETETPFIWELNKAFLAMWDPTALQHNWVLPDNFHVQIKVMDHVSESVVFRGQEFLVDQKVNKPIAKGRSLGPNVTHSIDGLIVRELVRRCSITPNQQNNIRRLFRQGKNLRNPSKNAPMVRRLWDLYEQSGYLSARILDHLDSTNIHIVDADTIEEMLETLPQKPFKILAVHDCFRVHPNYANELRKQYNLQLSLLARSDLLSFLLSQILDKHVPIKKQGDFADQILKTNYALS